MTATGNNYPNPLDNFRSHSYHFIMVAASNTEALRNIIAPTDSTPLWSRVNNIGLGEKIPLGGSNAYLVIDTRRYSQYSITDFESQQVFTGGSLSPTAPYAITTMKIIDTTGLSFFNFLMDLFRNKLQSMQMSSFFLLNVLFVGHRDDGTSETISSSFVPMILMSLGFDFTHIGSTYNAEFMEINGVPEKTQPAASLNDMGITKAIVSPPNKTKLGDLIGALEKALNDNSRNFYVNYANDAIQNKAKLGKLVQYMINLPVVDGVDWAQFELTQTSKTTNVEQLFLSRVDAKPKTDGSKAPAAKTATSKASKVSYQISFSENTVITDAIDHIMERCTKLVELGSKAKRDSGLAMVYKISQTITSDDTTYIVHFDIVPFYAPKLDKNGKVLTGGPPAQRTQGSQKPVNVIYYDYLFTGHNSHINDLKIEFSPMAAFAIDHNLEFGRSRFAANAAVGAKKEAVKDASTVTRKAADSNGVARPNDPIFASTKPTIAVTAAAELANEHMNIDDATLANKQLEEFRRTMANLNFLSSLSLTLNIRGNPALFSKYVDKTAVRGIPPHSQATILSSDARKNVNYAGTDASAQLEKATKGGFDSARSHYRKQYYQSYVSPKAQPAEDPLANGIDVNTLPVFVKLNIRAPYVDFNSSNSAEKYIDFFYDGVYQILTIAHKFSGGVFTQEMQLIPYDPSGTEVTNAISADSGAKT